MGLRYSSALCFQTATAFGYSFVYLPDFSGTFEKPYFIFLSPAMADQYREQEVEVVGEDAPAMGAAGTAQAAGMEAELGGMGEPPIPAPAGQAAQTQAGPPRGVSPTGVPGAELPGNGGSTTPPLAGFGSSAANPIPPPGPLRPGLMPSPQVLAERQNDSMALCSRAAKSRGTWV